MLAQRILRRVGHVEHLAGAEHMVPRAALVHRQPHLRRAMQRGVRPSERLCVRAE